MNITSSAGADAKSSSATVFPLTSGRRKDGARVPSGSIVDSVRSMQRSCPVGGRLWRPVAAGPRGCDLSGAMRKPGDRAPSFTLPSTSGKRVSLGDFAGRKVVLYFYPRDDTPGCTMEACDFRDQHPRVLASGAVVLGVSGDKLAAHEELRSKLEPPFELLSD